MISRHFPLLFAVALTMLPGAPLFGLNIDPKADIHPTAVLMGNVTVGPYTKIGPKVVIEGDVTIGSHVNILGEAVINVDKLTIGNYVTIDYGSRILAGRPAASGITANAIPDESYIKENCWVGMNATVRGSRLEEGSAIGMRAVADFNTHLERGAVLAPGAVTLHDTTVGADSLAEGNPAVVTRRSITDRDRWRIFGIVPSAWNRLEGQRIAREIDLHPPKVRDSYAGVDGKPYWKGAVKVDPTAQVHPTAILINATIGAHTRIGPNVVIARAVVGDHCDIRANTNIRADTVIGSYSFIGERVHIGSSRDGGFDNPLWIKDYAYIGPGSVVHATKIDDGVYYGANVVTDYGTYLHRDAVAMSGASILHDVNVRAEAVVRGGPELMDKDPGISDQLRMQLLGFLPRRWLTEVNGPALEQPQPYEKPLERWEPVNKGVVKGKVERGAYLEGNVDVDEGTTIYAGAFVEGNVHIGKGVHVFVGTMISSQRLAVGDHTHMYDQSMVVDGRRRDSTGAMKILPPQIGVFNWINHMASVQGASLGDFALVNIGAAASSGTHIGRAALLLNGAATYADQVLPPRSISYGTPAKVRITDSTMAERMFFFYGRDWPTWERQATAEELKAYNLPQ